jgi:glutathione S-transferase
MPELLGLPYSPWSEKARWALEARGVPYVSRPYAPLIGELALRRKLGRWRGPVSVPVLTTDDGEAIADSTAIARWADGRGAGPALFPAVHAAAIERWIARSEAGLAAGRGLSLRRVAGDREALREMVPRKVRGLIGPLAPAVGGFGIWRTLRKYGAAGIDAAGHAAALAGVLDELRAAIGGRAGAATLCGGFTFADVAMAQVLAFITPPAFGLRLGAASRRGFTDPDLAARYADLLAWRDAIYDAHRPRA